MFNDPTSLSPRSAPLTGSSAGQGLPPTPHRLAIGRPALVVFQGELKSIGQIQGKEAVHLVSAQVLPLFAPASQNELVPEMGALVQRPDHPGQRTRSAEADFGHESRGQLLDVER